MTCPWAVLPSSNIFLAKPVRRDRKSGSKYVCGGCFAASAVKPLSAQAEFSNQRLVAFSVLAIQVIKETPALRDELQQTTTGMIVLLVVLEMFGQVLDAFGKYSNLDFRRSGIALGRGIFLHQFLLAFSSNRHRAFPFSQKFKETGRPQPGCRPAGAGEQRPKPIAAAHIGDKSGNYQRFVLTPAIHRNHIINP